MSKQNTKKLSEECLGKMIEETKKAFKRAQSEDQDKLALELVARLQVELLNYLVARLQVEFGKEMVGTIPDFVAEFGLDVSDIKVKPTDLRHLKR